MKLFALFILAFGSKEKETVTKDDRRCGEFEKTNAEKPTVVKIEENEYEKVSRRGSSKFVGVFCDTRDAKWRAQRRSKNEGKMIYNGSYNYEEEAAHASDTLARKLMKNGEQSHKLNFPDDDTEVYKKRSFSEYIGVFYDKRISRWSAQRRSESKMVSFGFYDDEEKAAHASDTLARKLMKNENKFHKLNFPDDDTDVHKKSNSSQYIGVSFKKRDLIWHAQRRSKHEKRLVSYGCYDNEDAAAHASDTLAKIFMKNGEEGHKLNFPDDTKEREEHKKKRKRSKYLENLQDN